jgi:hypothetical protein
MLATGLSGVSRRRDRPSRRRCAAGADPVDRNFPAARADQFRVADITQIPTVASFLFLVSRCGAGYLQPPYYRLGDGRPPAYRARLEAPDMALDERRPRRHLSLRPGQPLRLACLRRTRPGGRRTPDAGACSSGRRSRTEGQHHVREVSSPPRNASSWTAGARHSRAEARMPIFSFMEGGLIVSVR